MVNIETGSDPISSLINTVPEAVDKITSFIKKRKGDDSADVTEGMEAL